MTIGGLQKVTLVDYPGRLACTVFLSGCNFRCPFCYSKELVIPEEIKKQPEIKEKEFFDFLKKRKGELEGCVICGGEPTIHGDGLLEFAKKIKQEGYLVKLDTNGTNPELIKKMIEQKLVDYIAMDIKAPLDNKKYGAACGVKNFDVASIRKSIGLLKSSGIDYEFRTTVTPMLHSEDDILKIIEAIAPADKYFIQAFRGEKGTLDPSFEAALPFSDEFFKKIAEAAKGKFNVFRIR